MRGRLGLVRPRNETELDPFRRGFADMFAQLRQDHGVRSYLAHNMTVTPSHLPELPSVTRSVVAARVLRAVLRHPGDVPVVLGVARRLLARARGFQELWRAWRRRRLGLKSFVVHHVMDASVVGPAWSLTEQSRTSDDPAVREAQERLGACMHTMPHPETGHLVPACTQHSVLDPGENARLRTLLPLTVKAR